MSWLFFASLFQRPLDEPDAKLKTAVLDQDSRVVPFTLLAQVGVGLSLAAIAGLSQGRVSAVSVLLGGLVAVVPNAFLAARLLMPRASDSAGAVLRSAWVGLIGKIVLTALLFGLIFALIRPLAPLAVFVGFIAAQFVVLGALLYGARGEAKEATTKS